MKRVIIILLDSLGLGYSEDAEKYGDYGSNTLGHIAEKYPLNIPNLTKLGIVKALQASSYGNSFGLNSTVEPISNYGYAKEISTGKDSVSGHWEIAGCPMFKDWGYFTKITDTFPKELTDAILSKLNLKNFLGNCHASGTEIIEKLGEEHIKTGYPIFYTSADSVFQIAAHEKKFGLEKLYKLCEIARIEVDKYNVGRVIARPFIGNNKKDFKRTTNRKDYAVPPPEDTILDIALKNNINVTGIGKTCDLFAHRGMSNMIKTRSNAEGIDQTLYAMQNNNFDSLIFTNLVDFDVDFGHRRNPKGYAEALEYFDKRLSEIISTLKNDDLLIITADHGNDPTWSGSDHTREHIPVLCYKKDIIPKFLGKLQTFSDIGASIIKYFNLPKIKYGKSFL